MKYRLITKYKYQILETFTIDTKIKGIEISTDYVTLWEDGQLFIWSGYAWDGSSVPLKGIVGILTLGLWDSDKFCKEASLVHDSLYQMMRKNLIPESYKEYIDTLYRDMCIAGGMSKRQANARFWALRNFAKIRPEKPDKIFET